LPGGRMCTGVSRNMILACLHRNGLRWVIRRHEPGRSRLLFLEQMLHSGNVRTDYSGGPFISLRTGPARRSPKKRRALPSVQKGAVCCCCRALVLFGGSRECSALRPRVGLSSAALLARAGAVCGIVSLRLRPPPRESVLSPSIGHRIGLRTKENRRPTMV